MALDNIDNKSSKTNQGRLDRVLSKLPDMSDLKKIPDIEENLISQWQATVTRKNEWKNLISKKAGDFAYSAFWSKNLINKKNSAQEMPVKRPLILKPTNFALFGRVLAISIIILFFSFLTVAFMPETTGKYLALIDNTLKKPVTALNNLWVPDKIAVQSVINIPQESIINKKNLGEYIINNQSLLKAAAAKGINSFKVKAEDINGQVAGAEEGQSCLYTKVKDFIDSK